MLAEETAKKSVVERAHINFLREAIYLLYTHNRLIEADRWMKTLRQQYPNAVEPGISVEQFALARMTANLSELNHNRTKAVLEGLMIQHFENLAIDNDERADGLMLMIRQIWNYYTSRVTQRPDALQLEPLNEMYARIRDQLIDPKTGFRPEYAARIRTKLNLPPPPATNAPAAPANSATPVAPPKP